MSSTSLFKCPNCGAQFDPEILRCPYCGYEITEKVREREEVFLRELKQKHRLTLKSLPGKMLNRYTVILGFVLAALILIAAGFEIAKNIGNTREAEREYREKEEMLAHLEDLYQNGEYEKMKDEYYDSGFYGASFGKYSNTAEIFSLSKYAIDSLMLTAEAQSLRTPEHLGENLQAAFRCLAHCRKMREEGFLYDEGKAVESMEAKVTDVMMHVWGVTEEEVAEGTERYVDRSTDYSDFAEELLMRFSEKEDGQK